MPDAGLLRGRPRAFPKNGATFYSFLELCFQPMVAEAVSLEQMTPWRAVLEGWLIICLSMTLFLGIGGQRSEELNPQRRHIYHPLGNH